jgi:formate hydrogenlyase subunit 3/multisubunit Na+/H+ antiporter MnhD subunit
MFILLLMSMFFVIVADNGIIFLIAWEIMAVSSFFLVIKEYTEQSAQDAGWLYLIATHLGTIFLIILFLYAAVQTGSFSFSVWSKNGLRTPSPSLLFLFAVIGFGTKAGFFHFTSGCLRLTLRRQVISPLL